MVLSPAYLTPQQRAIIEQPSSASIFLSGPAGTGKTTIGVERILYLLENGTPGNQILLLVPQRTLATPYYDALQNPSAPVGGAVNILTIGGVARRMVDLFWPIAAEAAGFAHPENAPTFLTLETAQYYMAHIVRPLFQEGYFDSLSLERNRLYSQIIDNLNKAAVHGFDHTEIGQRLKSSWVGEPGQLRIYEDAQTCANKFRDFCLQHNLLDFSLQLEIFLHHLWHNQDCRAYLLREYRHLIFDNLEEETPVTADLLKEWLPAFESVLLIYDSDAGYRRFLGADPDSTGDLAQFCKIQTQFTAGFVNSESVATFGESLAAALTPETPLPVGDAPKTSTETVLHYPTPPIRFYPDMLDWVADQIAALIDSGTPPGEIAVLAPYLSDALRYTLVDRLARLEIPTRSHRPSRSLREEPATRCLLTLTKLAHPQWGLLPEKSDVAYALMQAIADLDLVRAQLLTEIVFRAGQINTFDALKPETQERITYVLGGRYENLRLWLADYRAQPNQELDHFLSRLFGEVLSQPGYGFHADYTAGAIAANLVESVQKFRWGAGEVLATLGVTLGQEYLLMVEDGVIAAQYLLPWQTDPEDAVFLAPAYTFLMNNRPVDYQFWLDIGGRGWYERLYQPVTHPYILSRHWPVGQPWTDIDEMAYSQDALYRLAVGLIHRCREGIFLGLSDLGEQGYEHTGEFLRGIDRALQSVRSEK